MSIPAARCAVMVLIGLACQSSAALATPESGLRIREDLRDLSAAQRQLFIDAMMDMKAAPARGNGLLASNRYDEYARMHEGFRIHDTSGFLPWHRKLLWEFESDVRRLDPVKYANFTLPYWNPTQQAFPAQDDFRRPNPDPPVLPPIGGPPPGPAPGWFLGPDGNVNAQHAVVEGPFRADRWTTSHPDHDTGLHALTRQFSDPIFARLLSEVGLHQVVQVARAQSFRAMATTVEVELHNSVHLAIGGHMGTIHGAADDPVFWLLHAFDDMLWTLWQVNNPAAAPYESFSGGPLASESLPGFGNTADAVDLGFEGTLGNAVSDVLDPLNATRLGYTYRFDGVLLLSAVPEPGSLALAAWGALGLFGFCGIARRQASSPCQPHDEAGSWRIGGRPRAG